jgi:hypothetical protein
MRSKFLAPMRPYENQSKHQNSTLQSDKIELYEFV